MNKKTYYWILGILIALIAVFVVWGVVKSSQPSTKNPSAESVTENGSASGTGNNSTGNGGTGNSNTGMDHAGMNHNTANGSGSTGNTNDTDSGYSGYMKEQDVIMGRMMQDMELTEDTGNAALDFISGMVPHHAAAIEMAESYLKHGGEHKQLKPLAQDIITAQREEITAMETMYQEIQASGEKNQEQAEAYRKAYDTMMQGHHTGHGLGSVSQPSIDAAFAEGMLMHHQMAVDMAKDILEYTEESQVLELARQIIDTQEEEIKIMQEILNQD